MQIAKNLKVIKIFTIKKIVTLGKKRFISSAGKMYEDFRSLSVI